MDKLTSDCTDYDEELHEENRKLSWPFDSEDDEHRFFDNRERARDIRSSE